MRSRSLEWLPVSASSAALLQAVLLSPASAQDSTWQGTTNDWFTAANWSPPGVPSNSVFINSPAGTTVMPVIDGTSASLAGGVQLGVPANTVGTLTVQNGGSLTVNGALAQFLVGGLGQGTVEIKSGGTIDSIGTLIGADFGTGTVLVDGMGSRWSINTSGRVAIGTRGGTGVVTITNGGVVAATSSIDIGGSGGNVLGTSGTGTVTVDGAGSSLTTTDFIGLGNGLAGSRGTLTVSNGGTASATSGISLGNNDGSSSATLNIGAAANAPAAAPGTVTAPFVGISTNTVLNFNHTSSNYVFAPAIDSQLPGVNSGTVNQIAGTTILTGDGNFDGTTNISGGALQFGNGGTSGSIGGGTINNNAALVFNRSDTLTFGGNITGSGAVTQAGTGTTVLTGTNSYSGGTFLNAGTLSVSSEGNLGTGRLTFNGGTLQATAPFDLMLDATVNAGGGTFQANADVTWSGAISGTGALTKSGGGILTLSGANTFSGGLTVAAGTARAGIADQAFGTGLLTVNAGATADLANFNETVGGLAGVGSVLLGSGTLTTNQASDSTFSGVISGNGGGLTKDGSGTLTLTGANTYTGPTTINAGTLLVNGSITSPTTVNANGTLGGIGTITGDVTNAGTIAPGPGPAGPTQIGALTIAGNYVGNGGTLAINSVLGGDTSPTSQLILDGGNASGTTSIRVTNRGGAGAQTTNGIPVVVAQNGATTAANSFTLARPVAAGAYQYMLFQGPPSGGSGDANTWYLRSTLDNPNPPGPPIPMFRPEGPIHAAMASAARSLNTAAIGTFHERNGDQGLVRGEGESERVWARLFGQNATLGASGAFDSRFKGNMGGVQSGIDLYRTAPGAAYESRAGFFGAYGTARGDVTGFALGRHDAFAGNVQVDAFSVGGYWTQMGAPGWYVDTVVMGTRFDADGRSTNRVGVDTDGFGATASVEAGYPIPLGGGLRIEPQAQLVYQYLDLADTADAFSSIAHDASHGLAGRLGARLAADTVIGDARVSPYLKASVWQDWTGTDRLVFASTDAVDARQRGTSVEVGGGVTAQLANNIGAWASADYIKDVAGEGERRIVRGNVGMRWMW